MTDRAYQDYMIEKGVELVTRHGYTLLQLKDMPYFTNNWAALQAILDSLGAQDAGYEDDEGGHHTFRLIEMFRGDSIVENAANMVAYGYRVDVLRYLGYSVVDLFEVISKKHLREGGFSKHAIEVGHAMGKASKKSQGLDVTPYYKRGYSASDLRSAGFGAAELRQAGYDIEALKSAPFTMYELREAGYEADLLVDMGFGDPELLAAGFSAHALAQAKHPSLWHRLLAKLCFWRSSV